MVFFREKLARRIGIAAGLILALSIAGTASAAGPKACVGLFKDNAVAVLDTSTNRLITTIPIPTGPHGLVMTPDGRTVFASSDGGLSNSGDIAPGESFTMTFDRPGTYAYHCSNHPAMQGTVIVS